MNNKNNFFKTKKGILLLGILFVIIIGVVIYMIFSGNDVLFSGIKNIDNVKFKSEYEKYNDMESEEGKLYPEVSLSENNLIKYSSMNEILDIFKNNGNAVLYFGSPTCLYCRTVVEILCDEASLTDLDVIYYLDVEKIEDHSELTTYFDNELIKEKIIEDGKILAPLVVFVSNGKVVSYRQGTFFSQKTPYDELDEYQEKALRDIYRYGINDVLNIANSDVEL